MKIQKNMGVGGGRGGGVRVDVFEKLKFLRKLKKYIYFYGGSA